MLIDGQDKADCRESMCAWIFTTNIFFVTKMLMKYFALTDIVAIGANSNICDMDVHIEPNSTEGMYSARIL